MNENDIIILSHKINESMRHIKKEDYMEMLVNCVKRIVIIPRLELISTLNVLGEYIIEKNKSLKKQLDIVEKQAETWIFSDDNKNFSKLWSLEKEVPEKIQEMYKELFNLDVSELIEKHITDMDEFVIKINFMQTKLLRKWFTTGEKETERISENIEAMHLKELEADRITEENKEFNKKFIGGKTFKERQQEQEDATKIYPKESKKMENVKKIIDLKNINSIQEIKKRDKERLVKIFRAFEKKNGDISEKTKKMIMELWYGDYFANDQPNSNDILSISKKYSLHLKIPNEHINGEVNRLILQSYIVGLYMNESIFDIYTAINEVLETSPTMTIHKIMPSMIHDGSIPNLKVQEILNPIINNLPLDESNNNIRKNWDKMRFPEIDISALIEELKNIIHDNTLKFLIISHIEDLTENIVKKGLTIEKFAIAVYDILSKQNKGMKKLMTEKQIVSLLSYN